MSADSIVLIGPYLAGKSTIRRLLAEKLGLPQCTLNPFEDDALVMRYYREGGYDAAAGVRRAAEEGFEAADRYLKRFDAYAVERCVAEHPGHVIEIGATLSVYDDPALWCRVQAALGSCPNVFLLIPSPDREESFRVLHQRYLAWLNPASLARFIAHPAYPVLARHVVYSKGKTPDEVCAEVIAIVAPDGVARTPILLIGPPLAGKSTTANRLEVALRLPAVGLDVIGYDYALAAGLDVGALQQLREQEGEDAARYREQEIWCQAVVRVIADHQNAIVDFGAGHAVYDFPAILDRLKQALAPYPNVILLLPSLDPAESLSILINRPRSTIAGMDANRYLIRHHSNYELANHVVYTAGKTPEQTRDEILAALQVARH